MKYPRYAEIEGKKYKINTDFRVALKCNQVAKDESIGDFERALSIIYLLFGEEGINSQEHYEKLLEMSKKYLSCGEELKESKEEPDMDYEQDYSYIKTSFFSDYGIKLDEEKIHWWEFYNLLNGLSNSEFGNCCIFNRVRNLRNMDLSQIKDSKQKDKIKEAQDRVALKKKLTEKQKESINQLYKDFGIEKEV